MRDAIRSGSSWCQRRRAAGRRCLSSEPSCKFRKVVPWCVTRALVGEHDVKPRIGVGGFVIGCVAAQSTVGAGVQIALDGGIGWKS